MKIVLATGNRGKIREIKEILRGSGIEVLTLDDFPDMGTAPEDGATFEENALRKARYTAQRTGLPALADDSGLEVDSLGGRPGVFSARYAGPSATDQENVGKLLSELRGVPEEKRKARFRCVAAYADPSGAESVFEGTLEGVIGPEPRGEGGFGYDPVFLIPETGRTAAELPPEKKNAMSHRGRAFRKFMAWFAKKAYK